MDCISDLLDPFEWWACPAEVLVVAEFDTIGTGGAGYPGADGIEASYLEQHYSVMRSETVKLL
jgi:hypothetical protein